MIRLAIVALALCLAGCGSGGRMVTVCVRGDDSGADYDQLDLTLAFAAGHSGPICSPATVCFGTMSLPYCVEISPGPDYDEMVVVRARAYRQTELVARRDALVPFRLDEQIEYDLKLDPSCGPCEAEQHCREGMCQEVPWPGIFDEGSDLVDDVPCDPRHGEGCR